MANKDYNIQEIKHKRNICLNSAALLCKDNVHCIFSFSADLHIQKPTGWLPICMWFRVAMTVCAMLFATGVHSFNANINNNRNNSLCGCYNSSSLVISTFSADGLKTPCSVMMPVIRDAGVTSKAGFQQLMPGAAIRCSPTCVISRSGRTSIMI